MKISGFGFLVFFFKFNTQFLFFFINFLQNFHFRKNFREKTKRTFEKESILSTRRRVQYINPESIQRWLNETEREREKSIDDIEKMIRENKID